MVCSFPPSQYFGLSAFLPTIELCCLICSSGLLSCNHKAFMTHMPVLKRLKHFVAFSFHCLIEQWYGYFVGFISRIGIPISVATCQHHWWHQLEMHNIYNAIEFISVRWALIQLSYRAFPVLKVSLANLYKAETTIWLLASFCWWAQNEAWMSYFATLPHWQPFDHCIFLPVNY